MAALGPDASKLGFPFSKDRLYRQTGPGRGTQDMPELPEGETIRNKLRVPVKIDIGLGGNSGEMA